MTPEISPDDKLLERFLLGNATEVEEQTVLAFLERDPGGPERLKQIDQKLGTLITGLRSSGYGSEAAFWRGLHAARHLLASNLSNDPVANTRIGPFDLGKRLDHGGMGRVYVARDTRNDQKIALKCIAPGRQRDEEAIKRFRRESALITALDHPNIVRCLEAGECQGIPYLAMELLEGMDLGELVRQKGPLPEDAVVEIARQTARSLVALEAKGLVHRDLKPSNLFLTVGGGIKLLDLGLACNMAEGESSLTGDDWVLGTFDYMSPEQAMDVKAADNRSDLYSLGCTLFMLLTGKPPYPKPEFATPLKKALAHSNIPFPVHILKEKGISPRLLEALSCLCEKPPSNRPQSAREIESVLAKKGPHGDLKALLGPEKFVTNKAVVENKSATPLVRFMALAALLSALLIVAPLAAFLAPKNSQSKRLKDRTASQWKPTPNLVPNASFAKGLYFYMYQLANTGYFGEFVPDNTKGIDDRHSLCFEPNGDHPKSAVALISNNIPLEVGREYTLSVWFDASQMTKGNLSADLSDTHKLRLNAINGKPGWQKQEAKFTALLPSVRIRLIRDGDIMAKEKAWIDGPSICACLNPSW